MRIVYLGDSVVWGQGLQSANKFASQINLELGCLGQPNMLAHSGAIIGVSNTTAETIPAPNGEVPCSSPTIREQVNNFTDDPMSVDVVIINGGINDIGAFNIVNPLISTQDLQAMIERHCYQDMRILLKETLGKFSNPDTKIIVPCYYPILSEKSDPLRIPAFLNLHGIAITEILTELGDIIFQKIFSHCLLFSEQSSKCFQLAINDVNQQEGSDRIRFTQVPFQAENAALAPNSWLWGISTDLEPEDQVIEARHHSKKPHKRSQNPEFACL